MSEKINRNWILFLTAITTIAAVFGVVFGVITLSQAKNSLEESRKANEASAQSLEMTKNISSAQFIDSINQRVKDPKYDSISTAIEGDDVFHPNSYKVWSVEGGQFTEGQISDWIDNFDEVGNFLQTALIDKNIAYVELSYDVEKSWCNNSIQDMVKNGRKVDGSEKYSDYRTDWWGFEQFAKLAMQTDNKTCSDLNNE